MSRRRSDFVFELRVVHELSDADVDRLEEFMAKSFAKLMEEGRKLAQEIKDHATAANTAEVEEDRLAAERDQANADKIAAGEAKVAELEAQIKAGNLTPEREAEVIALIADIRSASGLPEATAPVENPPAEGGEPVATPENPPVEGQPAPAPGPGEPGFVP